MASLSGPYVRCRLRSGGRGTGPTESSLSQPGQCSDPDGDDDDVPSGLGAGGGGALERGFSVPTTLTFWALSEDTPNFMGTVEYDLSLPRL